MENKFAVVFDTNSYRQFVAGKPTAQVISDVVDMKIAEAKKSIQSYGIMVVGMEMLANLAEGESGFNYKDCLNGSIAMGNHCLDELKRPRVVPQPYLHLTRSFFGLIPTEIETRAKNMAGVVDDIRIDSTKAIEHHKQVGTFDQIKDYINNEESHFSTNIVDLIDGARQEILRKHPRIDAKQLRIKLLDYIENGPFEPFVAMAIIYAVSATLQIQLPKDEGIKRAMSMHLEFPLSVGFYKWICHKIVHDNIDMQSKASREKRWNWQWDYQVSFLISPHTIDNRELILVTSDGDMTQMLKDFGYQNKVLTLAEYIKFLEKA
ncbi:MAG: hypothetical protein ACJ77K_16105 [Bacteroidia bacterium]|jgi:hypothetical protein